MTGTRERHDTHGATFETIGNHEIPLHYGRPATAHRAVRNGVGVMEMPYDILTVTGTDRVDFVDASVTTTVTTGDGTGTYALLLDPNGKTIAELYLYSTNDQLLAFLPPGTADLVASTWRDHIIRRDVSIDITTTSFGVFGVHGPSATEKIASILNGAAAPDGDLSFVRGRIDGDGVTVVRSDNRPGEEGYEVICQATDADAILDSLLTKGLNAAPFGYNTWDSLTLEAGTPLFEPDLKDRIPVDLVGGGYDRTKGCFPGQEVIARIEDRGRPPGQLRGLKPATEPPAGAPVFHNDTQVGTITRSTTSPTLDEPVALAILNPALDTPTVTIGDSTDATLIDLPFVEGSARSARLPTCS